MNRGAFTIRFARLLQNLPLGFFRFLEYPMTRATEASDVPALFVLALPRSGSTVAYQAIAHGTDGIYLSNIWNLFYFVPYLGGLLSKIRCSRHVSDFKSDQGFVGGLCGPAEGLRFWSYWLGYRLNEEENARYGRKATRRHRPEYLVRALRALCNEERTFISGYIGHCLVADDLARRFPRAVFVRVVRDPFDNALSILRLRLHRPGMFSVSPLDLLADTGSVYDEVVSQVATLNRRLDLTVDSSRTISVSYSDLCEAPAREVSRIIRFCASKGLPLQAKLPLPARFVAEEELRLPMQDEHRVLLAAAFARFQESSKL